MAVLAKFVLMRRGRGGGNAPEQNYQVSFDSAMTFASGKGQNRLPLKQTSAKWSHPF